MNAPSSRFTRPLLVLILLTAFPVWKGSMAPSKIDDCADPGRLYDAARIEAHTIAEQSWSQGGRWGMEGVDGRIEPVGRREAPLVFRIERGWGLPARFLHPPGAFKLEPDRHETVRVDGNPVRLPVHVVRQTIEHGTRFSAYFFVYDHEPVTGAFWTRARWGFHELITGLRPITLVEVFGATGKLYEAATQERALGWLAAAWEHYRSACLP